MSDDIDVELAEQRDRFRDEAARATEVARVMDRVTAIRDAVRVRLSAFRRHDREAYLEAIQTVNDAAMRLVRQIESDLKNEEAPK